MRQIERPEVLTESILAAADQLDCGLAIYDRDGYLLWNNDTARRNYAYLFEALDDCKTLYDAVRIATPKQRADITDDQVEIVVERLKETIGANTRIEMPTQDGRIAQVYMARAPDGQIVSFTADVTNLRQREQELKRARSEAQAASEAKSRFLASMSHEIRTPLNGIIGMAQALISRDMGEDDRDLAETILDCSRNLLSLLNDILDLSKVEAGKVDITPVPDDLRHKLARVERLHRPTAEEKGLHFRLVVDPNLPARLAFDPVRVRQCVNNLVSNALKFTQEGSVVVAATSEPVDGAPDEVDVRIHVSDTGIGISRDHRECLFQKFTQAERSTTRRFGGTGLGLAITRSLARLMDGDCTVASKPGVGSVFTLTFRAGLVEPASLSPDQPTAPTRQYAPASLRGRRVLIVDDNSINRRVARLFLEPLDMNAEEAANGQEALKCLAEEPFDVVLMDIHMPFMDGVETFKRIRNSGEAWANTPVIALTADAMAGDREKFLGLGMHAYVSKPVDERSLQQALIEALAARSDEQRNPAMLPPSPPQNEDYEDLFRAMAGG